MQVENTSGKLSNASMWKIMVLFLMWLAQIAANR